MMKIVISQKTLVQALERGAIAALSEEAQSDTSIISLLLRAVHVKVEKGTFTVESATKLLASRYSIPATKDNGIEVKEDGEIFVPAKELYDWSKRQPDSKLAMVLSKLDTPDVINPIVSETDGNVVKGIKRIGTVKIASKDESKTGNKWSLDSYSSDQLGDVGLEKPTSSCFTIPSNQLATGLKNILFSVMPKHYQHVFDSVSFQNYQKFDKDNNPVGASRFFMLTCDTARSAVCEIADIKDNTLDKNLLVPAAMMSVISKLVDENEDVSFGYDEKTNKVYITQEVNGREFITRMSTSDRDLVKKFPPINIFIEKKYVALAKAYRDALANRLLTSSLVNDNESYFSVKGDEMNIYTTSSSGKSPSTGNVALKDATKEYSFVVGSKMLMDFLKVVKDSEVEFLVPEDDDLSVKFQSKEDESFCFYIMTDSTKKAKYEKAKVENEK